MRNKFKPKVAGALVRLEQVDESGETVSPQYSDETYYIPRQAAYILGCSERTLSKMTADGRIGYEDFGNVIRYSKSHLMDCISGTVTR